MLTRSPARSQSPKYSAVKIDTHEALLAWWPPTLVWSALGRTWFASWIMRVASHSTRCWMRSSAASWATMACSVTQIFSNRRPSTVGALARFAALVRVEHAFAHAKGNRRDLDQLVRLDEVERLLEAQLDRRREPHRDIRGRRTHVALFLFLGDVECHVFRSRIDTDDHAFVYRHLRFDEGLRSLLRCGHGKRGDDAGFAGDQHAVAVATNWSLPGLIAEQPAGHDAVPSRSGQQQPTKADQTAGRHAEFHAQATMTVVVHVLEFAQSL